MAQSQLNLYDTHLMILKSANHVWRLVSRMHIMTEPFFPSCFGYRIDEPFIAALIIKTRVDESLRKLTPYLSVELNRWANETISSYPQVRPISASQVSETDEIIRSPLLMTTHIKCARIYH